MWNNVPILMALAAFATFVLTGNVLTADKAFVSFTYINMLKIPMAFLPFMIIGLVQVKVSLDRINRFINNEDLDDMAVSHDPSVPEPVKISKATFKWDRDESDALKDINMSIKKGSLTAIVGPVGSGKSSLISAILGDMEKVRMSRPIISTKLDSTYFFRSRAKSM